MFEPDRLLLHAGLLLDASSPAEADIRRAISAAYYAVFHLLTVAAARQAVPDGASALMTRLRRGIDHRDLRKTCDAVTKRGPDNPIVFFSGQVPSTELRSVALACGKLQEARLSADYDLDVSPTLNEARLRLAFAEAAFASWTSIAASREASIFLTLILHPGQKQRSG